MTPILELRGLTRRFGGLVAVRELDMTVMKASIHGLIGPNGAGKSTAFDLISGLTAVSAGRIVFESNDVTYASTEARVRAGVCRTFQMPKLFEDMTSFEAVMTGCHLHARAGFLASAFGGRSKSKDETRTAENAYALLEKVGIAAYAHTRVSQMPYGPRRMVEIARALATRPKLLLLDEVASGLNPVETNFVADLVRTLRNEGLTIILVEHDMHFIMSLCERVTVLNFGSHIGDGTPAEIVVNQEVVAAYLGQPRVDTVSRRELRHAAPAQEGNHS